MIGWPEPVHDLPEHWSGRVYPGGMGWVGEATYDGPEVGEPLVSHTYDGRDRAVAIESVRTWVRQTDALGRAARLASRSDAVTGVPS